MEVRSGGIGVAGAADVGDQLAAVDEFSRLDSGRVAVER